MKGFILAFGLALYGSTASATLITTVRADYFTPGTNVSTITAGVTFTAVSERDEPGFSPNYSDVFAYSDGFGRAVGNGLRAWGMIRDAYQCMSTGELQCRAPYDLLQVDFVTPVQSFDITNYWWSDGPAVYAFNSAGEMIAYCTTRGEGAGCDHTVLEDVNYERLSVLELTRTEHDIARLWIGGHDGIVGVRELSFSVPEPSTAGLFGLGLLAAGLVRRRAAQRVRCVNDESIS